MMAPCESRSVRGVKKKVIFENKTRGYPITSRITRLSFLNVPFDSPLMCFGAAKNWRLDLLNRKN